MQKKGEWDLKGLLIHIGEYLKPAVIDENRPTEYNLEYAKFDEKGVVAEGQPHIDPEFETFTYGDDPRNRAKKNLGKLEVGDYIFFMWTFIEKHSREKARYIPGYFRIEEILTVEEILQKSLGTSPPYCNNDHVRLALKGLRRERKFTIFVGDPKYSKRCKRPMRFDKILVKKLDLRDSSRKPIAPMIGKKRNKYERLMSEVEVISVYTRIPKILDENQVLLLLREMERKC